MKQTHKEKMITFMRLFLILWTITRMALCLTFQSHTSSSFHPLPIYSTTQGGSDQQDIVARRIMVKGDVNGGYVRTCILNEAGRFRKLIGTMSPPGDSDTAEIYVEGTSRNVDGFIRWCKKGTKSVGLSQTLSVVDVIEEEPTGLYDGFYVKTGL